MSPDKTLGRCATNFGSLQLVRGVEFVSNRLFSPLVSRWEGQQMCRIVAKAAVFRQQWLWRPVARAAMQANGPEVLTNSRRCPLPAGRALRVPPNARGKYSPFACFVHVKVRKVRNRACRQCPQHFLSACPAPSRRTYKPCPAPTSYRA